MAINLLDMLKDQLGGEVISQASKLLGEKEDTTKSALGAALPTILGSLIQKGATPSGAGGIMDMLSAGKYDGGMLSNLSGLFGGGDASNGLMDTGGSLLKGLLGDKLGSIVGLISSVSGIGKGSSSSLMSMAAPLIMSMIGKQVKSQGLGASGLMKLLGSQLPFVKNALPSGISDLMGLSSMENPLEKAGAMVGNMASKATATADTAVNTAAAATSSGMSKLVKWGLPLLAIAGLLWFFSNRGSDVMDKAGETMGAVTEKAKEGISAAGTVAGEAATAVSDVAEGAVEKVGDVAEGAADAVGNAYAATVAGAKKALEGVSFAAGSVGEKFTNFLMENESGDATFSFNNLTYAIGSANIDKGSLSEVDNLAKAMKAFPNVTIEVSGHTDNTGNAAKNKTLSMERANSVKNRLVAQGISADRITTIGHGSEKPKASNDTEEGKKQNRRIEVKITKR